MTRRWFWIAVALWVGVFVGAVFLDRPISDWVDREPLFNPKRNSAWKIPKRAGEFQYILPVIVAVAIFHPRRWRGAVLLLMASAIAGAGYSITKWIVGRARPSVGDGPFRVDFFTGGIPGLVSAGNLAFPSGHAAFAFAIAAGMAILIPKWWWLFYLIAAMCGAQRILEHAHHPSDVVASALLGFLATQLAARLCQRWLPEPVLPVQEDAKITPSAPATPSDV